MNKHPYALHVIPEDERITLNQLSSFEIASILSHRISQIGKDFIIYLPEELRYVDIATLDDSIKKNLTESDIIKNKNGTFAKLTSTSDIVYGEINTGNIPYNILRYISVDHQRFIINVEVVDPNALPRPTLEYFSNRMR